MNKNNEWQQEVAREVIYKKFISTSRLMLIF